MTHQEQLEIGAYLLGALPPRERSAFEEHLAHCAACRNEIADLAGIPALLGKVTLSEIMAAPAADPDLLADELRPGPGPEPFPGPGPGPVPAEPSPPRVVSLPDAALGDPASPPRVVPLPDAAGGASDPVTPPAAGTDPQPAGAAPPAAGAAPRRPARVGGTRAMRPAARKPARKPIAAAPFSWRHRTVLLAAAAVLAALAAVGSLAVVSVRPGPVAGPATTLAPAAPGESRTLTLVPAVAGVQGSVQIAAHETGSLLRLTMGGVRPGQQCSLLVSGADGRREPVATWTAGYDGDVELAAESALGPAAIRWVGVTSPDGGVLLQARLSA